MIVAVWIGLNVVGVFKFDVYPFILLNLAFSLQAAYAAPLILLAQTQAGGIVTRRMQKPMPNTVKLSPAPVRNDSSLPFSRRLSL